MPPRRFVRKFTLAVWIFGIAAISILGTGQAYAQVAGATLTGTVNDSSSGIIPNAQVAITDVATAVTRSVSSGGAELYPAPNLLPGHMWSVLRRRAVARNCQECPIWTFH